MLKNRTQFVFLVLRSFLLLHGFLLLLGSPLQFLRRPNQMYTGNSSSNQDKYSDNCFIHFNLSLTWRAVDLPSMPRSMKSLDRREVNCEQTAHPVKCTCFIKFMWSHSRLLASSGQRETVAFLTCRL